MAVGRQVGVIIDGFTRVDPLGNFSEMDETLRRYADLITPWAQKVTARMHGEVAWRDLKSWNQLSEEYPARSLTVELASAPTGAAFHKLMAEQVH